MKISLIGYGKMGKAIEEIALARGHKISFRVDVDNENDLARLSPENTEVAIEFTHPAAAYKNIEACILQRVPVISGTTGWLDKKSGIETLCLRQGGTFFHASNFSIGVNIFFRINEIVAGIMKNYPSYVIGVTEIHHTEKKDAPSGTAISLAEGIISKREELKRWTLDESGDSSSIRIEAIREGKVPGTHIIRYQSGEDKIELKHEAFSRKGFAVGAVMVAEWIKGKSGVLSMKDFLDI